MQAGRCAKLELIARKKLEIMARNTLENNTLRPCSRISDITLTIGKVFLIWFGFPPEIGVSSFSYQVILAEPRRCWRAGGVGFRVKGIWVLGLGFFKTVNAKP